MIRPSPEIEAVVRRWNTALQQKNGPTLINLLSESEHLRYQGSGENESWQGPLFRQGFGEHADEIPDFDWQEHSLEAFEKGDTGWAHCLATLTFHSNGNNAMHRFTFVLCLENGSWRMVQLHVSNATSNVEKMGVDHHALDALILAAQEGYVHDQTEGMASVMFTDIANSTAISELLGDRVWTATVQDHFSRVAESISAAGGRMVKSLGDGTMSTFPSARAALAAAIDIQRRNASVETEPPLSLRIGVHTGDVIQSGDDFFGTVVNMAARVAAAADPDEIRVSDATRLMVGTGRGFALADPVTVSLKGLEGSHVIHRLEWA